MSDTDPKSQASKNAESQVEKTLSPNGEIPESSLNEVSGGVKIQTVVLVENPDGTVSYQAKGELRSL